ncbi:hypothetical protein DAI22_07g114150 [Oryza sativa Japonica Group]|nr:hypothetical protein DAI22_07g114150 [Oryza sativa Japonica Group]
MATRRLVILKKKGELMINVMIGVGRHPPLPGDSSPQSARNSSNLQSFCGFHPLPGAEAHRLARAFACPSCRPFPELYTRTLLCCMRTSVDRSVRPALALASIRPPFVSPVISFQPTMSDRINPT